LLKQVQHPATRHVHQFGKFVVHRRLS
jgi:hypothetical protein